MTVTQTGRQDIAHIHLILLTRDGERFVCYANAGGRLSCPRLTIHAGDNIADDLGMLVTTLASQQLGLDVSYLGLVTSDVDALSYQLVVAAVARRSWDVAPSDPHLRVVTLAEVRARVNDLEHGEYFENILRWHDADATSAQLGVLIRRAMDTSITYLDKHLAVEDSHWGWNQYLDGDSIGLLSTAEGLLAHGHAGAKGEFIDKPMITLEDMQNPDGGWQVRRALIGTHSNVSITESTCSCLRALYEMGRSVADKSVRDGIAWLEALQRPDGGWPSSAGGTESLTFPTTSAVLTLSKFKRADPVAKGVAWLRSKQSADGGWGRPHPTHNSRALRPLRPIRAMRCWLC